MYISQLALSYKISNYFWENLKTYLAMYEFPFCIYQNQNSSHKSRRNAIKVFKENLETQPSAIAERILN